MATPHSTTISTFGLEPHPHAYMLRGYPGSLAFPPLCASCGAAAPRKLAYEKAFTRSNGEDSPNTYVVSAVQVPFCDACLQRHVALAKPRSPTAKLLASLTHSDCMSAIALTVAAVFVGGVCLKNLFRGNPGPLVVLVPLGLLFALMARFQARSGWTNSAHLRVDPGSEVTRAFDYGDTNEDSFQAARFTCTIRDPQFAAAFATLNQARLWIPGSPEAQAELRETNRRLWKFGIGLALLLLALMLLSRLFGE